MAKDDVKKIYSESIDLGDHSQNSGSENISKSTIKQVEDENKMLSLHVRRLEEESAMLRELFNNVNTELANLKKPALLVADVISLVPQNKAVIKLPNGNKFLVYVGKDVKNARAGDAVLVDQKSLNVVDLIDVGNNYEVEKYVIIEKPQESWKEVGGLKREVEEVKEVIELPLKKPKLFEKVGIQPPKGLLLYGPPGTGKTLLAKAVAHSTNATFIEVVGSELVQKFIGEGAKLVKDIFALARLKAPTILFIDELDSLAATRMDTGTSGEREVNRTFMQLLAEIDGFKPLDNVKVIGATNRLDILDPAIIRPGRLDRLIEVGLPDKEGRLEIFKVHTRKMNLQKVDLAEAVHLMDSFSGADIRAVCMEAGFFAIRENREYVTQNDFAMAVEKVRRVDDDNGEHKRIYG